MSAETVSGDCDTDHTQEEGVRESGEVAVGMNRERRPEGCNSFVI